MKVIYTKDYNEISEVCTDLIIEQLQEKSDSILGLATGSSPIKVYQNLIKAYEDKQISFKDVKTYNLDEYIGIDKQNENSYFYFMHDQLFNHIDIDHCNVNFPETNIDHQLACDNYNEKLFNNKVDLQLLGIGTNGHIGFNEPGTSFESTTHVIELDIQTRLDNQSFFNSLEEVPTHAITMGIKNILDAKKIIIIASGLKKAPTIKRLLEGERSEEFPASILFDHDEVYLIIDEEAASLLD